MSEEREAIWMLSLQDYDLYLRSGDVKQAVDDLRRGNGWLSFEDPQGIVLYVKAAGVDSFRVLYDVDPEGSPPSKYRGLGDASSS
jgi:hypothetical protein